MKKLITHCLVALALVATPAASKAASSPAELDMEAQQALASLLKMNPLAADLAKEAKAVLIFPDIVKAGFIFGGAYGEGSLLTQNNNANAGYYNLVSASWGFQAGAQSYKYAMFLMTDKAVNYLKDSHGWEIGVGPTVVIVDEGAAKNLSTSTARDDAYGFVFGQEGLMASLSLEGTKISKIKHP